MNRSTPLKRTPFKRSNLPQNRSKSICAQPQGGEGKTSSARRGRKVGVHKKKARPKVTSRKRLIKILDGLVFQMVLARDKVCVECGSAEKPTTGHVLSRRSYSTRWDLRNVFRQCWPCNYKAAMTAAASYHLWFVKKFGVDAFDQLYRNWTKGHKYTRLELQNLVPEFEAKLAEIKFQLTIDKSFLLEYRSFP